MTDEEKGAIIDRDNQMKAVDGLESIAELLRAVEWWWTYTIEQLSTGATRITLYRRDGMWVSIDYTYRLLAPDNRRVFLELAQKDIEAQVRITEAKK